MPGSIYLAHYTLAASSGTPIVRADGAVKIDVSRRYPNPRPLNTQSLSSPIVGLAT